MVHLADRQPHLQRVAINLQVRRLIPPPCYGTRCNGGNSVGRVGWISLLLQAGLTEQGLGALFAGLPRLTDLRLGHTTSMVVGAPKRSQLWLNRPLPPCVSQSLTKLCIGGQE